MNTQTTFKQQTADDDRRIQETIASMRENLKLIKATLQPAGYQENGTTSASNAKENFDMNTCTCFCGCHEQFAPYLRGQFQKWLERDLCNGCGEGNHKIHPIETADVIRVSVEHD